jgi:CHAT domain-containing protein/Tfp pilus assembly protein PilF
LEGIVSKRRDLPYRPGRCKTKFADAISLAQRVLSIREKVLGPDHPDVARSLSNLATFYTDQDRYADAEPLFKRSLSIREKVLGSSHLDVATSLVDLAGLYREQGRYADAEPLYRRSLNIRERGLGPNHPDVAESLNYLAVVLLRQDRKADAEPLLKLSLSIRERALGPNHPEVMSSLNNLAGLYWMQGRYADAEPLWKTALSRREKLLGSNHPDTATTLNNLGVLYWRLGRYADSEQMHKRALAIRKKAFAIGENHPAVAESLSNLGTLYQTQGRYDEAEPLFTKSLAIQEKVLGPDHPNVATSLNKLGSFYEAQGRYADAESLLKRSLSIREKLLGPNHSNVATSISDLGSLYESQGRYAEAESSYKQALEITEKTFGPEDTHTADSLNNIGLLYSNQGRYADAEPLLTRSLAIVESALGPNHRDIAALANNLAELYKAQGRYADAEPLYQTSLGVLEKALGPNHPNVADSLNNLGDLYREEGRYPDAESLLKRSLAIREKLFGSNHQYVAQSLGNLARVFADQKRYLDAEPLFKRSLLIREHVLGPDHPQVAISLNNLASMYRDQGRFADALPLVKATAQKGFDRKATHLAVLSGALATSILSEATAKSESYLVAQQAASSAASNAINQLSVRSGAGNDELAQLGRREQDLSAQSASLDKILVGAASRQLTERDLPKEGMIRDRLNSIHANLTQIESTLNQQFPRFAALSKPTPISISDTQSLLTDDEGIVLFDFDAESYAWIITRTNADWVELKISSKDLGEQVKRVRASLTFDIDKPFDRQLAWEIYNSTFGPIADKLEGKKRLSIVTNGALTGIPFQLLVTKGPRDKRLREADWLVRSYAITNLPSVASLKTLRSTAARSSAQKPMIAFADPIFSKEQAAQLVAGRSLKHRNAVKLSLRGPLNFYEGGQPDLASLAKFLPQLPDTANEVRQIGEVLKADNNDLKLGALASETMVKQTKLDDYRIVYFATHGLVAGEVERFAKLKAEPALALTIPEKPTELDDGLLTASEVAQLKMNADWVVLSACNTAAEGNPGAEALSGLARAFFYAGARSLVVSHWEVDSEATVQLMTGMFEASARNPTLSHAEALQQSVLSMIDNAKSDDDLHPRVWAPFVVVGEPAAGR